MTVLVTQSFRQALPPTVLCRYDFLESRNAAQILRVTNPAEFDDLVAVLELFRVEPTTDIFPPRGNESRTASRLNESFRARGWREAAYRVTVRGELILRTGGRAEEGTAEESTTEEQSTASYLIDNVKGRVDLDVEWHAKDGNLDRDIAAYRTLYDAHIIDGAVMVTMTREAMRAWAVRLDPSTKKFSTSTTTNLEKATPRIIRGDGGGCPVLIASICDRTV